MYIDPIPIDPIIRRSGSEQNFQKFSHHFEEKQKVRVRADGRVGRIENFNAKQHVNVRLDSSSHLIECHPDEIEPADWQDSPTAKLQRAMAAGRVPVYHQTMIKIALAKIATGRYTIGPFGELLSDGPHHLLEIFADEYADGGDVLNKRARSKFSIGQSVIEKFQRRAGTVTDITPAGLVEIQLGPGNSCLCIPSEVEAA